MATRLQDKKADLLERVADRLHDKLADPLADARRGGSCGTTTARCRRTIWSSATRSISTARRWRSCASASSAGRARPRCGSTIRSSSSTAGSRPIPWSRSSTTTCRSWSTASSMELNRLGLLIHLMIHPVLPVRRDADGTLEAVLDAATGDGGEADVEIFMHVEIDRQSDPERLETIRGRARARARRRARRGRGLAADAGQDRGRARRPEARRQGARCRRSWTEARGVPALDRRRPLHLPRLQQLRPGRATRTAISCGGSRARRSACCAARDRRAPTSRSFAACRRRSARRAREPVPLIDHQGQHPPTVHRPVYLDYIGVKRFDAEGKVVGEHRFLGLFTSAAYNRNPRQIPLLRPQGRAGDRARRAAAGRPLPARRCANILETYPRDELFQIVRGRAVRDRAGHPAPAGPAAAAAVRPARPLRPLRLVPGLRAARPLQHRRCARASRRSCSEALGGTESEFQAQLSESILARLLFIVRTPDGMPGRRRYRRARARGWSRPRALARPAARRADRRRTARRRATGCSTAYGAAFPAGLSGAGRRPRGRARHRPASTGWRAARPALWP